ncbi:MAG: hypothetical protein WCK75_02915 [Elusimicrobiota bacterium]
MAKKTLTDPAGAAADFMAPGAGFGDPLAVYFAYCAAYALLLYIKPVDFPSDFSETAREFSGKSYAWLLAVHSFLDLAFSCTLCAIFATFAGFMKDGRLIFRLLCGCAVCGAYAAAAFYYKAEPLFALPFLTAAGAAAYAGVRAKTKEALAFFRFSLVANAAMLICLPASLLAAITRNETLYTAAEFAGGIWLMVLIIKAAKAIFGGTTVRSTLTLLFSMTAAVLSFYTLKNLGIIPSSVFRFMMFM